MSWTPIADMIEAMFTEGASLTAVLLAVRALEERHAERHAERHVTVAERSPGAVRSARWRAKNKLNQGNAKANDVALVGGEGHTERRHAERYVVTDGCDLSSLLTESQSGNREVRKKKQTELVEGQEPKKVSRGTRMVVNAALTDAERQFARDQGMGAASIDRAWAEFKDYWIGIPGHRGTKLDWSATWRNRVRQISGENGASNGYRGPRPLQDDAKSASRAAGRLAEAARRGEFEFAPRPTLGNGPGALPGSDENVVRLLPKG